MVGGTIIVGMVMVGTGQTGVQFGSGAGHIDGAGFQFGIVVFIVVLSY
jgi:hypothetical protein